MARKSKGTETEFVPTNDQLLLKFEDLTVTRTESGSITVNKLLGGISDHTAKMFATGNQKYWNLFNQDNILMDTGNQNGNRSFEWSGSLEPGLYTLSTGPTIKDFSKHRVPGRGYHITFRI